MSKELRKSFCLIKILSVLLLFISCKKTYNGDLYVIESYKKGNSIKLYSPDCYIYDKNDTYQIENILHYIDGKLAEVINPSAEGLIYYKNNKEMEIPEIYKKYNSLLIKRNKNIISYFNIRYSISSQKGDSIFVKTSKPQEYIIFVGKIPNK